MIWEYYILQSPEEDPVREELNRLGEETWELVSVNTIHPKESPIAYLQYTFKRKKVWL